MTHSDQNDTDPDITGCDQAAVEGAEMLAKMEAEDLVRPSPPESSTG
jgi:hypothetical protein